MNSNQNNAYDTYPVSLARLLRFPSPLAGEGLGERGLFNQAMLARARKLRRAQVTQEQQLWQYLRAKRFKTYKFRRQQPIGKYVVDFVCFSNRLIIELDGGHHASTRSYDMARERWLKSQDFQVLRFWNNQWMFHRESVLRKILKVLQHKTPSPLTPPPRVGRGMASTLAREWQIANLRAINLVS